MDITQSLSVVPTLLITGPIGAGKTSVAAAVAERLRSEGVPYAMVDLDAIVECYPAPPDDPFNFRLAMANLASLWHNFQAAGARCLVLNWVVESRAELAAYRRAIPGARITVVRLRAPVEELHRRINRRGTDSDLAWSLARARQLAEEMDATALEDLLIETSGKTVEEIAEEILRAFEVVVR